MALKTKLKIPDLWFDVYARLLPGTAFVAAIRVLLLGNVEVPNGKELFVLAFAGYLFALITQPISSRLARLVWYLADKVTSEEVGYVDKVKQKLGRSTRESLILSKMHGEVTFFCQLSVLSVVYQVIQLTYRSTQQPWNPCCIVITFVFVAFAFEVATRCVDKAKKYDS